jgi:hypothetical protein
MYELPNDLKDLFRHWGYHLNRPSVKNGRVALNIDILTSIDLFVMERMHTWYRKIKELRPYTIDPIISKYRFCNIYRELDKQTIAIHSNLLGIRSDFNLWLLNVSFHRFVCNPETVKKAGWLSFDLKNNNEVFDKLSEMESPKYGSAYVFPISAIQKSPYPTREEFFCFYLPQVIPQVGRLIQNQKRASVGDVLKEITRVFGFNLGFHWTEILIDVAYQYPENISLFGKFPIGPGSKPTMKLINANAPSEEVVLSLVDREPVNFPYLTYDNMPILLSTENWEGIGCEYRKYIKLRSGLGRKRKYGQ